MFDGKDHREVKARVYGAVGNARGANSATFVLGITVLAVSGLQGFARRILCPNNDTKQSHQYQAPIIKSRTSPGENDERRKY